MRSDAFNARKAVRALKLAQGPVSISEFAQIAELDRYRAANTLHFLMRSGRAVRVSRGVYVLNPERRAA